MALKNLSTEAMVQVTEAWINPAQFRLELESIPIVKPILPRLERRYQNLREAQAREAPLNEELEMLKEESETLNSQYDMKARGLNYTLFGVALLADNPEETETYQKLRDILFPDGLKITQRTYTEKAGALQLLKQRWTPEHKTQLTQIPTPWGTLADELESWFASGERLGVLANRRAKLLSQKQPQTPSKTPGITRTQARNAWIRTVHTFKGLLLEAELDNTDVILSALNTAEAHAETRRKTMLANAKAEALRKATLANAKANTPSPIPPDDAAVTVPPTTPTSAPSPTPADAAE